MRALVSAVFVLMSGAAAARGSETVRGDGNVTAQQREVPAFDAVRLETSLDVDVTVGPARSVTVKIDGNLQDLLTTTVRNGVLVIDAEKRLRMDRTASVVITVPELRRFDLDGSGDVVIAGGKGPVELVVGGSGDLKWRGEASRLLARIDGSGTIGLEGSADDLQALVDGSGDVNARRLEAVNADARVSGSGDIELTLAGGKLSAAVEGSGDIHWRGQAKTESIAVSGSGEISRGR